MAQQVTVTFNPTEYKYHYDCIRIKSEDQTYIVPFHGYPVINKVDFPRIIKFSDAPLCEVMERKVTLKCSIPMPFGFSIQVLRPHPYFRIEPMDGIIPGEGSVDIKITFSPITLGTCSMTIKLHVAQHGYKDFETVVSARAVTGLLEKRGRGSAHENVSVFASRTGASINDIMGNSIFKGTITLKKSMDDSHPQFLTRSTTLANLLVPGPPKKLYDDPVGTVLSSTFRSYDLTGALDKALKDTLLGSRRKYPIKTGNVHRRNLLMTSVFCVYVCMIIAIMKLLIITLIEILMSFFVTYSNKHLYLHVLFEPIIFL